MNDFTILKKEFIGFRAETNQRLEKLENQQAKTNLGIGEVRLSVIRLADKIEELIQLEPRVKALEKAVFK